MGKYYKMVIDPEDNIHVIINKDGYGKRKHEEKNRIVKEIYDTVRDYAVNLKETENKLIAYEILKIINRFYWK